MGGIVSPPAIPPVFVGGTGRSGTTITAWTLGRHSRFAMLPNELAFLTRRRGLLDLVDGETTLDRFVAVMPGRWYRRTRQHPDRGAVDVGLFDMIDHDELVGLLDEFNARFPGAPVDAAAGLVAGIGRSGAARQGKPGWVDHTPDNAVAAHRLVRLLPDMRLVVVVRDGRDVVASARTRAWAPDDAVEGIGWWEQRMIAIHRSLDAVPSGRVLTVRMEDLVSTARMETWRSLFEFLSVEPERRAWVDFEAGVDAQRANIGRWRLDFADEADRVDEAYREALERLRKAGVTLPALDGGLEVPGG